MFSRTLIALAFALASAGAAAQSMTWLTGLEYSSGDYGGSEDIEDLYVPVTGRLDLERVSLQLTVPYLSVRAPEGTTVTDPGSEPIPGTGETVTESGIGDVIAGMTIYDVVYLDNLDLALDLTGKVKFGTADEDKGLGTGENDYTLRTDLYKFAGQFTWVGSVGYKFRGEPAGADLDDVWLGSIGGIFAPRDDFRFGMFYDYRESALTDSDAFSEVSAFAARQLNDRFTLQFYAFTGFSDSSPDWGAGILLQII